MKKPRKDVMTRLAQIQGRTRQYSLMPIKIAAGRLIPMSSLTQSCLPSYPGVTPKQAQELLEYAKDFIMGEKERKIDDVEDIFEREETERRSMYNVGNISYCLRACNLSKA